MKALWSEIPTADRPKDGDTFAKLMSQRGQLNEFQAKELLSGSNTPLESMPAWLRTIMQLSPSTHFVSLAQAILYRGAGFDIVWLKFVEVGLMGGLFLFLALLRYRSVAAQSG